MPWPQHELRTQEAATEAPDSPPTVRRTGRNRKHQEGSGAPMVARYALDTTVQGLVGRGGTSNQVKEEV